MQRSREAAAADDALAAIRANGPPSTLVCAFRQLMFAEEFAIDHPGVPVIVIGSEDDVDAAITSLHAGVADYVTPPLTRRGLPKRSGVPKRGGR